MTGWSFFSFLKGKIMFLPKCPHLVGVRERLRLFKKQTTLKSDVLHAYLTPQPIHPNCMPGAIYLLCMLHIFTAELVLNAHGNLPFNVKWEKSDVFSVIC